MAAPRKALSDALKVTLAHASLAAYRVYQDRPNNEPGKVFIVFSQMSEREDQTYTSRIFDMVYAVQAISHEDTPDSADTADSLIDTVLERCTLSVSGYTFLTCRREGGIVINPMQGRIPIWQRGGLYRIKLQ